MRNAQTYMKIVSDKTHCRAVAPHAYLPYLLDDSIPEERAMGLEFGIKLLDKCQVLVVCGDRVSTGMKNEIAAAIEKGIKIVRLDEIMHPDSINITLIEIWGD